MFILRAVLPSVHDSLQRKAIVVPFRIASYLCCHFNVDIFIVKYFQREIANTFSEKYSTSVLIAVKLT